MGLLQKIYFGIPLVFLVCHIEASDYCPMDGARGNSLSKFKPKLWNMKKKVKSNLKDKFDFENQYSYGLVAEEGRRVVADDLVVISDIVEKLRSGDACFYKCLNVENGQDDLFKIKFLKVRADSVQDGCKSFETGYGMPAIHKELQNLCNNLTHWNYFVLPLMKKLKLNGIDRDNLRDNILGDENDIFNIPSNKTFSIAVQSIRNSKYKNNIDLFFCIQTIVRYFLRPDISFPLEMLGVAHLFAYGGESGDNSMFDFEHGHFATYIDLATANFDKNTHITNVSFIQNLRERAILVMISLLNILNC